MASYVCTRCGQGDRKLWRVGGSSCVEPVCAPCVAPDFAFAESDQHNGYVPAVPTEGGEGWYGYTSVPPDRVLWWYGLPTHPDNDKLELQTTRTLMLRWRARYDEVAAMWLDLYRKANSHG